MTEDEKSDLRRRLKPVLVQMESQSTVAERFVDKDTYRIYLATLWSNLVLDPVEAGLQETELEAVFDLLNESARPILGGDDPIKETFRFISSSDGERAMNAAKLRRQHQDLLTYFASMILDPDGHKKWMEAQLQAKNRL